ncbi:TPA: hypothetical protein QCR38_003859 [Bacillus cereus]|nr:hypothetical protein [Bacillus cereus]
MPVPGPPVDPNPLTQLTTYIPMASAMLGALIGGTISYLNLNRQFKEQRKRDIEQERKSDKIAINAVSKEIEFNCIQLLHIQEKINQHGLSEYHSENLLLSKDKWVKHSDILEFTPELEKLLENLQYFYLYISSNLTYQKVPTKGLAEAIQMGMDLKKELKDMLNEQKVK